MRVRSLSHTRCTAAHPWHRQELEQRDRFGAPFPKLLALTANSAREWFHEVETSIPPNSDDRISSASGIRHNVDDLDRDNAASPSVVTMQMLCRVALGDDEDGRVSSRAPIVMAVRSSARLAPTDNGTSVSTR